MVTGVLLFVLGFGHRSGPADPRAHRAERGSLPPSWARRRRRNNFFRQIGSTLGASLVGALFTSRLTADLPPSCRTWTTST